MAWRKRFRSYGGRVRRYGYRRSLSGRRFVMGRSAGSYVPTIAGVALGYFAPRVHPMQDLALTTLAVLPIGLPYGIKRVAQGYVLGMIAKGFIVGSGAGTITQSDFA